jgi:hypothetical protein
VVVKKTGDGRPQKGVEFMGALVNAAIPFAVGVYCLLVGFRVIGKKPGADPKFDAWHARFGIFFKVAGPILILLAIFYLGISR